MFSPVQYRWKIDVMYESIADKSDRNEKIPTGRWRREPNKVSAVGWWSDLRCALLRKALLFTSELLLLLPLLQSHAKNAGVHLLGCNIRVKERERKKKTTNSFWATG